jgi:MFS-type transporter involved in bile tolerance (Atg22 family)
MIPEYLLLNTEFSDKSSYWALAIMGGLFISVASSNVRALLMNVNLPSERGRVFSFYNFFDSIGKGAGPAIGGLILASTSDYQFMVNIAVSFWLLCALVFAGTIFTVENDRKNMLIKSNKQ